MSEQVGGAQPAAIRLATDLTVADRVRRRWRLHQQLKHGQHCNALDRHLSILGAVEKAPVDWEQYALGIAERRARGIELREAA